MSLRAHLRRAGGDPSEAVRAAFLTVLCTRVPADAAPSIDALSHERGSFRVLAGQDQPGAAWILSGRRDDFQKLEARLVESHGEAIAFAAEMRSALGAALAPPASMQIGSKRFSFGERSFVMGVLNVTPDSFSDHGKHFPQGAAIAHGRSLAAAGADILDVGGESTRPGAEPVSVAEEIDRVVPVVESLARQIEIPISIDTTKAAVADAAIRAGACLVNDISAFRFDPEMLPVIARHRVSACAMHMQGEPRTMQREPRYFDVVGEVLEGLRASIEAAVHAGVAEERLLVDPGIGFGKTAGHNLFLLRNLSQLRALGRPIVVGTSRKSFIGKVTGRNVEARLPGTLATVALAASSGADVLRVHDVAEAVDVVKIVDAIARATEGGLLFDSR